MKHEKHTACLIYLTLSPQSSENDLQAAIEFGRFYYRFNHETTLIIQSEVHTEKRLDGKTYTSTCEWFYAYATKGKASYRAFIGQGKHITLHTLEQVAIQIEANMVRTSDTPSAAASNNNAITHELPPLWLQLSKMARKTLLQLGTQLHGSLPYRPSELPAFDELAAHKLVSRGMTMAGGRIWQLSYDGLELLLALPEAEDCRLKWIRHLHTA